MIYIASPYSSPIRTEVEDRAYMVGTFAVHCVNQGHKVYCPIASWHHLAKEHVMRTDHEFWWNINQHMIFISNKVFVLKLKGWENSLGVAQELNAAKLLGIPIRYFNGETFAEEK